MKKALFIPMLALLSAGCVHYMPATVSSTSIGSKYETPVKTVTGTSSAYYVLGLGPTGDDSLNAAIEDAKSNAPSDSIANVFVDRKLTCFPICGFSIFTRIDTMIYGTLVKYNKEDGSPLVTQSTATTSQSTGGTLALLGDNSNSSKISFDNVKGGQKIIVLFTPEAKMRKKRIDGRYTVMWVEYKTRTAESCAMIRPEGSGYFSRKLICSTEVESMLFY